MRFSRKKLAVLLGVVYATTLNLASGFDLKSVVQAEGAPSLREWLEVFEMLPT